jgi:phosphohistidine phosphatase SixA
MRKTIVRYVAFCLAALVCLSSAIAQDHSERVIFLVRHAEKESQEHDAALSIEGQNRSACLARVLRDANIKTIYVTEFIRTQQTARPLANSLGISPKIVPASDIATVVAGALKKPSGVLIVGHSDTIPEIVARLTGKTIQMDDREYDKLILVVPDARHREPIVLRYCERAPAHSE